MNSLRRLPWTLSWIVVGSLSSYCSLALDLDRYGFDGGGKAGTSGSAGAGGEAGEPPAGGAAGTSSGGSSGGGKGGAGGVAGGGGEGLAGGAGGEAGAGGAAPDCDAEEGPTNPNCELVPVAVYLSQVTSCLEPNVLGFAVEDSGGLAPTPLPIDVAQCAAGGLVVAPNRRHLIALTTGSSGQITYTYDIDPATFELEENLQTQPEQTSGEPDTDWDTAAVFPGPASEDHDFLFAANTASSGVQGGLYLYSIDRASYPGRITELDRFGTDDPWSPTVHPSGEFVYYLAPIGNLSVSIRMLVFDVQADTLANVSQSVQLESGSSPRQLALDAAGEFLFLLDEAKITSFTLRAQDGFPTRYVSSPALTNVYLDRFALNPGGRFLYAVGRTTLRAYESIDGALSELDLDGDPMNGVDNALALTDGEDVAIDASGRSLYLATRQNVRSFAIGADGLLTERLPATARGGHRLALLHALRPRP